MKNRFKKHLKNTVILTEAMGSWTLIIAFTETTHTTIRDEWYSQRKKNIENERLRVVEMAMEIIRQDIRDTPIDLSYSSQHKFPLKMWMLHDYFSIYLLKYVIVMTKLNHGYLTHNVRF